MSCQQVPTTPAFNPYPRSVQVGEFEVAIGGGIWVAIGVNCSAVAEKPLRTPSGCVRGVRLDVVVLRADKAAPAPSCGVRIFFIKSPMDGVEKQ